MCGYLDIRAIMRCDWTYPLGDPYRIRIHRRVHENMVWGVVSCADLAFRKLRATLSLESSDRECNRTRRMITINEVYLASTAHYARSRYTSTSIANCLPLLQLRQHR